MLKPLPIDRSAADAKISVLTFIAHVGFDTQELAHMLDSLVRVSRRVGGATDLLGREMETATEHCSLYEFPQIPV